MPYPLFPVANLDYELRMMELLRDCRKELGSLVFRCHDFIPWTRGHGYGAYRTSYIERIINDEDLLQRLEEGRAMPSDFGRRLDERVVEYPWVLSKLSKCRNRRFLDAGAALNHRMILQHPRTRLHKWTVLTLTPELNCPHRTIGTRLVNSG